MYLYVSILFVYIYMQAHQKIVLLKNGDDHKLYYEDDNIDFSADLNEPEYKKLFECFQTNTSFSTPDKMIQDNVTNGNTYPTFKTSMSFTNNDMKEIVNTFKKEMDYAIKENTNCRKNPRKLLKNTTRRQKNPKLNKEIRELLRPKKGKKRPKKDKTPSKKDKTPSKKDKTPKKKKETPK